MTNTRDSGRSRPAPRRCRRRRGHGLVYVTLCLGVLVGVGALGVDMSRVRTAKAELQSTTDAAARYAATAMRSQMASVSAAGGNAAAVFAESKVDGAAPSFNAATDLTLGIWLTGPRTFTPASIAAGANAVRIQSRMTLGDAAHPLALAGALGNSATVHVESIAMVNARTSSTYVSGKGNPWLSGMPAGTVCTNFRSNPDEHDTAGAGPNVNCTPGMIGLAGAGIAPGATIIFDGVTGGTNYGPIPVNPNADGDASLCTSLGSPAFNVYPYMGSSMNGMSNLAAPVASMVAVFLGPDQPDATPAPAALDFTTAASRDYVTLAPLLKQPFFVGDARRANGEAQQIVVPPGATRLYIGNMDGWQWNNNVGGYNLSINSATSVSTVK